MNAYQQHADGLKQLRDELGDDCPVLTYNGGTIKILPGGVMVKEKNSMGGFSIESDFQFTCLAEDFEATPESNESITYLGISLKIESVVIAPGGYQFQVNANHAANGL